MSPPTLAVILNHIWHPTETFIRRHVEYLLPGQTVVLAKGFHPGENHNVDFPVCLLDLPKPLDFGLRVLRRLGAISHDLCLERLDRLTHERVSRFCRKHSVTTILAQYMDTSLRFLPLSKELGIPLVVHAHGYDISSKLRDPQWRQRYKAYNDSAGVVVPSRSVKERLVKIGLSPQKIHVVPCSVTVSEPAIFRSQREVVRALAVGRMTGKKGPLLTLKAFEIAWRICPSLRLDFIGDGDLYSASAAFVRERGLESVVALHGYQPPQRVYEFMTAADVFLQHSIVDPATGDEEGLPVAILEAMSHSLPVISTRHAGIPEAVIDGETGFLVDEWDARSMAERIAVLAENFGLRRGMGEAGWQRARKFFQWERERQALLSVLQLPSVSQSPSKSVFDEVESKW